MAFPKEKKIRCHTVLEYKVRQGAFGILSFNFNKYFNLEQIFEIRRILQFLL